MCSLQPSARFRAYVAGRVSCGVRQNVFKECGNTLKECVNALVFSQNTTEASPWCAVDSSDEGHR